MADFAHSAVCLYRVDVKRMLSSQGQNEESPLLDYFLVHELAHFVHELSVQGKKVNSLTFGGNISIYRSENPAPTNGVSTLQLFSRSHAEVDQYTILIFKRLKQAVPYALIKSVLQTFIKRARASGYEDEPAIARLRVFEEAERQELSGL